MRFSLLTIMPLMATAIPAAEIQPEDLARSLAVRVNQPEQPWMNSNCFVPESREEHKKYEDCPKKKELKKGSKGDMYCPIDLGANCESYCEKDISWSYGKEQPFDNGSCDKDSKCTISNTQTVTLTETTQWSVGISHGAFNLGASFSWSDSKATANGISHEKPDVAKGQCGYWAFVPYVVTSCGKSAKARIDQNIANRWCADRKDEDICVSRNYRTASGLAGGKVIFVATDCDSNKPLPFCFQSDVYVKMGVARDDKVFQDFRQSWKNGHADEGPTETSKTLCQKKQWP